MRAFDLSLIAMLGCIAMVGAAPTPQGPPGGNILPLVQKYVPYHCFSHGGSNLKILFQRRDGIGRNS